VAARAAGTAVPVRADITPSYAGGGAGPIDIIDAQAEFPTVTAPHTQEMMHAPAVHRAEWPASREVSPGDTETPRVPLVPVVAQTDVAHARTTAATAPHPATMPHTGLTQPSDFDAPQPTLLPLLSASPEPHRVPAARDPAPRAPATHTATGSADPAPLMPRAARPAALAPIAPSPVRRGGTPQGSTATAPDDSTEVHIHIGRIDVTAVHEAPAPRRRTPAAPAPMSLDGYLAKQGRS
jgi:hypothetical protein